MAATYRDARLKVERAEKHIAELHSTIASLENTHASTIQHYTEEGVDFLKHVPPNLEQDLLNLSLIVGDIIHNLHTALDYAWVSTIERLIPSALDDFTRFPVRNTREELEAALKGRKIDTLRPDLFQLMVSDIQPYRGHNGVILILHELDVFDKHLIPLGLHPTTSIKGLTLKDPEGGVYDGIYIPLPADAPYNLRFRGGVKVQDKGKFSFSVVLKDAGPFKAVPIFDMLTAFRNYVSYTVKLFENL